jgi:putative RecB family exonuclease
VDLPVAAQDEFGSTIASRPTRYSPSALRTLDLCPRRFEFQYLEHAPASEVPTPELVLGIAVHAALAALYRLPPERRNTQAAHRALRHAWRRARRPLSFYARHEEAAWGKRGLEMLTAYCAGHDLGVRPIAVEGWVRARLGSGLELSGKVDRVDPLPDGHGVEVVDFKTGRPMAEDELPADLGAQIYAIAAWRTFRRPVKRVRYIYLADPGNEITWSPLPGELALAKARLEWRLEELRRRRLFKARPGTWCVGCPYTDGCPGLNTSGPNDPLVE